jgi:hypothetical protein
MFLAQSRERDLKNFSMVGFLFPTQKVMQKILTSKGQSGSGGGVGGGGVGSAVCILPVMSAMPDTSNTGCPNPCQCLIFRTLHGSNSLIQDRDPDAVRMAGPILGRLTHQETLVPIFLSALVNNQIQNP